MKMLKWLNRYMEEVILVLGVGVMILVIFFQVVMRYCFNNSQAWSEEVARYVFIWQVWLAVPYAGIRGRHIRLELLHDALGNTGKMILDMIFFCVSAFFFAFIGYQSFGVVAGIIKMNQLTPVLQIPKWLCYLSVPVGSFLGAFRFAQYGILRVLRFIKDPGDTTTIKLED